MNVMANVSANASKIGHGVLLFAPGWRGGYQTVRVFGGPYDKFPAQMGDAAFGVCVRAEKTVGKTMHAHVPLQDFTVPSEEQRELVVNVIQRMIDASLQGKVVYVGCMGGFGRTGLFLALVAKAMGETDPVGYVRQHYTSHAVETEEQQAYVKDFDVTEIKRYMLWTGWKRYLRQLFWR